MSIIGLVSSLQAVVPITLLISDHPNLVLEFVVDTGFTGYLMLPLAAVKALGLTFLEDITANLANDQDVAMQVYGATIDWDGARRNIRVLAGGRRPLLGTALLSGNNLNIDFVNGGSVIIDNKDL